MRLTEEDEKRLESHASWCKYQAWNGFGNAPCDCHVAVLTALRQARAEDQRRIEGLKEVCDMWIERCSQREQERDAFAEKLKRAVEALEKWKCLSCGGTGNYKQRSASTDFETVEIDCRVCACSGLNPIAKDALARLREG